MKLISLYIENFGCLKQFELDFNDGLTVLYEANGFGKTTLAEFIRAMFYGFPRGSKSLDKNKRKKYIPWNGGRCGGWLVFEFRGDRYRMERTFGATPKGDSFRLIDLASNKKSDRFSENVGLELFGLDAESFERSTYMPQTRETGELSTDSIRAKLGDLVEDTNDINNYDKAVAALRNKRSSFVPYRGNGGVVAEARSRVSQLQEELDRTENSRETLAILQAHITDGQKQLEQAERALAEVREEITVASQHTAADSLRRQFRELQEQHRKVSESAQEPKFAAHIPDNREFEEAQKICEEHMAVSAQMRSVGLFPAEEERLRELRNFFAPGVPEDGELDRLSGKLREWNDLRLRWEHERLSDIEQDQMDRLERYFRNGVPEEDALDDLRAKQERVAVLRRTPLPPEPKQRGMTTVLWVLSALAAVGYAALLAVRVSGSWLALLAAILAAGCALMLGVKGKRVRDDYDRQKTAWDEAEELEREICDFAHRYGETPETLQRIQSNRIHYLSLRTRRDTLAGARERTRRMEQDCAAALKAALRPYFGTVEDLDGAVSQLRERSRQMRELTAKQGEQARRETELRSSAREMEEKLCDFLSPYVEKVDPTRFQGQITQLHGEVEAYLRRRTRLEELDEQLRAFRQEHGAVLEASPQNEVPEPDVLMEREKSLSERISRLTREILEQKQSASGLQEQIDRIPVLRDDLACWQAKKDQGQANADTLDAALVYLERARESLSHNYLGTIQRSFNAYLERMMDGEKPLVTSDLEVRLERQGETRELGYFSAGQTELVMLCMRLALVDALFGDVKPFVILDDPFVDLDDEHTKAALELLRELSRQRQIIYLVCNSSRI